MFTTHKPWSNMLTSSSPPQPEPRMDHEIEISSHLTSCQKGGSEKKKKRFHVWTKQPYFLDPSKPASKKPRHRLPTGIHVTLHWRLFFWGVPLLGWFREAKRKAAILEGPVLTAPYHSKIKRMWRSKEEARNVRSQRLRRKGACLRPGRSSTGPQPWVATSQCQKQAQDLLPMLTGCPRMLVKLHFHPVGSGSRAI